MHSQSNIVFKLFLLILKVIITYRYRYSYKGEQIITLLMNDDVLATHTGTIIKLKWPLRRARSAPLFIKQIPCSKTLQNTDPCYFNANPSIVNIPVTATEIILCFLTVLGCVTRHSTESVVASLKITNPLSAEMFVYAVNTCFDRSTTGTTYGILSK